MLLLLFLCLLLFFLLPRPILPRSLPSSPLLPFPLPHPSHPSYAPPTPPLVVHQPLLNHPLPYHPLPYGYPALPLCGGRGGPNLGGLPSQVGIPHKQEGGGRQMLGFAEKILLGAHLEEQGGGGGLEMRKEGRKRGGEVRLGVGGCRVRRGPCRVSLKTDLGVGFGGRSPSLGQGGTLGRGWVYSGWCWEGQRAPLSL